VYKGKIVEKTEAVVVLTTVNDGFDAAGLARTLVERGLAACVNVFPAVTSVYRWEDKIQTDAEQQLLIKTTAAKVVDLEKAIRELHPYDLPEFIVLPVIGGSASYLAWIKSLDQWLDTLDM
jgi:periplasmic divalent cation tolerance protein